MYCKAHYSLRGRAGVEEKEEAGVKMGGEAEALIAPQPPLPPFPLLPFLHLYLDAGTVIP